MALCPEQFRNPLQTGVEEGGRLGLSEETIDADGILLYADGSAENTPPLLDPTKPNGRKHDLRVHIPQDEEAHYGTRLLEFPGTKSLTERQNRNGFEQMNGHAPTEVTIFEGHVPLAVSASA